jgi:hypothetical protein
MRWKGRTTLNLGGEVKVLLGREWQWCQNMLGYMGLGLGSS